jgi:hypothetical protein
MNDTQKKRARRPFYGWINPDANRIEPLSGYLWRINDRRANGWRRAALARALARIFARAFAPAFARILAGVLAWTFAPALAATVAAAPATATADFFQFAQFQYSHGYLLRRPQPLGGYDHFLQTMHLRAKFIGKHTFFKVNTL